jgi:hypothetical protein
MELINDAVRCDMSEQQASMLGVLGLLNLPSRCYFYFGLITSPSRSHFLPVHISSTIHI